MSSNMPPAEVEVDAALVVGLLAEQWPAYDGQPVTPWAQGWDNFLFRVGTSHLVRLPRREIAVELVDNEVRWLPELAERLPLRVPVPRFVGEPGKGYPWRWTVVDWLAGESAANREDLDLPVCARQLAGFLAVLHQPAPPDAPVNPYRGIPLADRDLVVRERIERRGVSDAELLAPIWDSALTATPHPGPPIWMHGDLHPHNLLADDGLLTGVIDFGDINAADPATDLAIAWMFLPIQQHKGFADAYGDSDEDLWARARGWALHLGLVYLDFSADNPVMTQIGGTTIARLVEEASRARG
jgi:aminoglycoside phosphotransferase (APT) family kinase protein